MPGAPFYAGKPDVATFRLSFATADLGKIEEGGGEVGEGDLGGCLLAFGEAVMRALVRARCRNQIDKKKALLAVPFFEN